MNNTNNVEILTAREVCARLKISLSSLDQMQSKNEFPKPTYKIACKRLWSVDVINGFLESCKVDKEVIKKK